MLQSLFPSDTNDINVFYLNSKIFLMCQGNPIIWRFQIIIKENRVFSTCSSKCYFITIRTLIQLYMYLFGTEKKSPSSIIVFVPRNGSCFLDSTPHTKQVTSFWRRPPKIAVTIVLLPFGPMNGLSLFGYGSSVRSSVWSLSKRYRINSWASCCWYPLKIRRF